MLDNKAFNPIRSLGFMSEQILFWEDCEEIVEGIAGYGETISEVRCRKKTVMT